MGHADGSLANACQLTCFLQERKRSDEAQREREEQAARLAEAARRSERLTAELAELQDTLDQKQELIAALQVGAPAGIWQ